VSSRRRIHLVVAVLATLAIVTPLAVMWWQSRLPSTYSVMDMGYLDHGGGSRSGAHHSGTSVADLRGPVGRADVVVDLVARQQRFALASGRMVDGFTLNGTSPGPRIDAVQDQLVEVRIRNDSVRDGMTLHWHGVDVPNGEDGVAGVTQDAIPVGGSHTYRFVPKRAGSYWYHSHQVSHEQVRGGLLGALVIRPRTSQPRDVLALTHVYGGKRTVNGHDGAQVVAAAPGERLRVRVVNTDNATLSAWTTGGPSRVLAVDGYDLGGPTPVTDRRIDLAAGGRVDLEVVAPRDGTAVRVELGGTTALVIGGSRASVEPPSPRPGAALDLLGYGSPAALPFDAAKAQRRFRYDIGRRPGFVDGRPGMWWSINGKLFPDVPMFVVDEGDVVRMTVSNHSGEVHPMHLHGHHAVVLSRNGVRATGSPWWVDSLDVASGDSYEIAFVADNPGIWMDHCHNLPHAVEGLVAHLMYTGVSEPFRVGGPRRNEPE
jgi:FtsP/CotA-like multicopper oxidase with cupredoxin domain